MWQLWSRRPGASEEEIFELRPEERKGGGLWGVREGLFRQKK